MPFDNSDYRPIPEGHRRLLVLAEFLETRVDVEDFDLNCWTDLGQNAELSCGTVACACGWASAIPQFRNAGYSLSYTHIEGYMTAKATQPVFGELVGWSAVEAFFGIDDNVAERLFLPDTYDQESPLPGDVAARIRSFVAERTKVLA